MDGYRLTQKVKQDAPDTKTIIMTGRHEGDCLEMMATRKPYANRLLAKTFCANEIGNRPYDHKFTTNCK